MGNFANNAITDVGRMLLADVQAGAVFTPTRIVIGSGTMPSGATTQGMTDVITPVKSLQINKKKRTPDGKCIFGGVYTNAEITAPFYFRELALYAKAVYHNEDGSVKSEGAETLYSYGNAGTTADYMAAYSTSTVVEKQMDLVTWVGNNAQVDLTIESGVFVTQKQAVLNMQRINPSTVGYDSILEYMASIYDQNIVVVGLISGFSDMPEGVPNLHGTINVVGTQMTISGNARTSFYFRGTNSRTEWTSQWRRVFDGTTDITIEKAAAAVRMITEGGTGSIYKNANATIDNGLVITDETNEGVSDRINFSAARALNDKLRFIVGDEIYRILHTGNIGVVKPADIGAAPAGYGLGETGGKVADNNLNNVVTVGFYSMPGSSAVNHPTKLRYSHFGTLLVERRGGDIVHQTVRRESQFAIRYSADNGTTWGEWEYVNPQFESGVEYRTTERRNGSVVFKKLDKDGVLKYRLDGSSTWIPCAEENGAVKKTGDTMTGDLNVEKNVASLYLKTPKGTTRFYKNAHDSDFGTVIYDETEDGTVATLTVSAARTSVRRLQFATDGTSYTVLHEGNLSLFGLGAVPASVE